MKNDNKTVTERQLHQYVDGELTDSEAEIVAKCIDNDDRLKKKVEDYREINLRLKDIFNVNRNSPIPARLLLAVTGRRRLSIPGIAASILWLGIGAVLGFSLQNQFNTTEFLRPLPVEAAFAHTVYVPEVLHPVEVNASEQKHLNAWLSKRLDRPISTPDLREAGFSLIGGRLLPDGHRAAAQFMFEDTSGKRITLFIRQALNNRETSFLHAKKDQLGIVYWVDDGLAYAVTAVADKEELTRIASIVYREVNP